VSKARATTTRPRIRRGQVSGPGQATDDCRRVEKLERDVAQARARFVGDLTRLRSPENFARFKDDLWAEARETKDDLVDKAREAAEDGAQRVLTELKERAAANPLARDWRGVSFTARRLRRC
jgi:hypothetical protein